MKLPRLVWRVDKGHFGGDIEECSVSGDVRKSGSSRYGIGVVRLLCRQICVFSAEAYDGHPFLIQSKFLASPKTCVEMFSKNSLRNTTERSVPDGGEVVSVGVNVFVIEEDAGVRGGLVPP